MTGVQSTLRARTPLDKSSITLSVLIPVYNERETIDEIIAAIRRSDYPDKEIVVVDEYVGPVNDRACR